MTTTLDILQGATVIDTADFYVPTEKQALGHACSAKYLEFGGSVGCGKSVFGCMEGTILNMEYPGNVGLICRWELEALRRTTLNSFDKLCPPDLITGHNQSLKTYHFPNGSKILYMGLRPSAKHNSLARLGSLELGWFFIDEATEVPKEYFDMLKTRLRHRLPDGTFPRFRGLLASNPGEGWIKEIFVDQELPDHKFIPALPHDNPHLPPGYIDDLIRDLPVELVEQFIKGSWDIMKTGLYVFPYQWIRAAVQRELVPGEPKQAGIDPGGGGDETVGAFREGPVVTLPHRSRHKDTMQTVGELRAFLDEYRPETTRIDTVGIGAGIYDRLKELKYNVLSVVGGAAPRNKKKFLNARAENHWTLRDRMEEGDLDLPDDPVLQSQLGGIKYEIQSDKVIKIESKKTMKARNVTSPNRAEAVIYAFCKARKGKPEVWIVD